MRCQVCCPESSRFSPYSTLVTLITHKTFRRPGDTWWGHVPSLCQLMLPTHSCQFNSDWHQNPFVVFLSHAWIKFFLLLNLLTFFFLKNVELKWDRQTQSPFHCLHLNHQCKICNPPQPHILKPWQTISLFFLFINLLFFS